MRRVDHEKFFDMDLPRIESEFQNEERFVEFLFCLDKAIHEIMRDPANEGAPLVRPPLAPTYRKKKFHSVLTPKHGVKADMRLVYRYDTEHDVLYVFGVGIRKPHASEDVYEILNPRDQI
ncbi:hypothetical protein D2Q93_15815 [Alicyclobacillaceae bacterium I2511]|jgi:hypothetical protein|nr:hypothetical protein D2Q93_15815 [Alicyclobacillaceae bacterium I2511]